MGRQTQQTYAQLLFLKFFLTSSLLGLLDAVEEFSPIGAFGWEKVKERYNEGNKVREDRRS